MHNNLVHIAHICLIGLMAVEVTFSRTVILPDDTSTPPATGMWSSTPSPTAMPNSTSTNIELSAVATKTPVIPSPSNVLTQTATATGTPIAPTITPRMIPTQITTLTNLPPIITNTPVPMTALPTVQSSTHIGFNPAQQIVYGAGTNFTVEVSISNADKPVRGIQADVKYDPQIMTCSKVEEGTFLSSWASANGGSSMLFPSPKIDNTTGTISGGADIVTGAVTGPRSAAGGATGSGSFLKLTCQANAIGVAELTLQNVELDGDDLDYMRNSNILGVVIDPGEVFVRVMPTPTPGNECVNSDVNLDGVVSVGDLVAVGLRIGEKGVPGWILADVNQDGAVSVGDMIRVGNCFGRKVNLAAALSLANESLRTYQNSPGSSPTLE